MNPRDVNNALLMLKQTIRNLENLQTETLSKQLQQHLVLSAEIYLQEALVKIQALKDDTVIF